MTAISNRQPPVDIEYDCRGDRKRKSFANGYAGRAFYQLKLKAGKNPKVRKPKRTDYCSICHQLFPTAKLYERPPADGLFCLECSKPISVPGRIYSKGTNAMNAETKQRFVEACQREWQRICFDIMEVCPEDTMKAEEVQEVLCDYVNEKGWWKLTPEERAECLAEAVPYDQSM
jgi:hypothetical protein